MRRSSGELRWNLEERRGDGRTGEETRRGTEAGSEHAAGEGGGGLLVGYSYS